MFFRRKGDSFPMPKLLKWTKGCTEMVVLVFVSGLAGSVDIHSLEPNHLFYWLSCSTAIRNISAQSFPGVMLPVETRLGWPGRTPLNPSVQCHPNETCSRCQIHAVFRFSGLNCGWSNKRLKVLIAHF